MIDLSGRVALITGAGGGLGREHALLLAKRGARIIVNDFGGTRAGAGGSATAAESVAIEIRESGGEAIASEASVADFAQVEKMVEDGIARWGKIDILVNNAGILRDKSFAKMSLEDFRSVIEVHLMGAFHCTKAVWASMKSNRYGRVVMTTSSSGLYGNFGQANYSAAKLGLVGLMQTLALEGASYGIRVNCLAPTAGTRMLDGLLPPAILAALAPAAVSAGILAMVAEEAPTRTILCGGAGSFEQAHITLTRGIYVGTAADAAESIAKRWDAIGDPADQLIPINGGAQIALELQKAGLGTEVLKRDGG